MERYIHTDGQQIGLATSLSLLQSLQNNNIKNVIRICIGQCGFVGDDFEPLVVNTSIGAEGVQQLVLTIGTVVFPNGEVFAGQRFKYTVPIERSDFDQFLIISYRALRQHHASYAPGFTPSDEYYMRRDGLSWRLVDEPDHTYQGLNELRVAKISFPPGGEMTVTDLRQKLYPYYGTDILASSESLIPPTISSLPHVILPDSIGSRPTNKVSMPCNREFLTILRHSWGALADGERLRYYTQIRFSGRQYSDYSIHTNRPPYSNTSNTSNVPVFSGTTYELAIRRIDRNNPKINTVWLEESDTIGGYIGDPTFWPCEPPEIQVSSSTMSPSIRVLSTLGDDFNVLSDDILEHSYIQIWVKDGGRSTQLRPEKDPVTWEIPAILVGEDQLSELTPIPKRCYYPSPGSHRVVVGSRAVFPGHRCSKLQTAILQRNEEYVQCINFGLHYDGDSAVNSDAPPGPPWSWNYYQHDHQRWCFTDTSTYYVAVFPCQISDGYLVSARFENYYLNAAADSGLLHIEGYGDTFELSVSCNAATTYKSDWSSDVGVPLVGETKLYFILEPDGVPAGDWVEVQGRLWLTFRTGTE